MVPSSFLGRRHRFVCQPANFLTFLSSIRISRVGPSRPGAWRLPLLELFLTSRTLWSARGCSSTALRIIAPSRYKLALFVPVEL
jgi:hypothetical protein